MTPSVFVFVRKGLKTSNRRPQSTAESDEDKIKVSRDLSISKGLGAGGVAPLGGIAGELTLSRRGGDGDDARLAVAFLAISWGMGARHVEPLFREAENFTM